MEIDNVGFKPATMDMIESLLVRSSQHTLGTFIDSLNNQPRLVGDTKFPDRAYVAEIKQLHKDVPPNQPLSQEDKQELIAAFNGYTLTTARLMANNSSGYEQNIKERDKQIQQASRQTIMEIGAKYGVSEAADAMLQQVDFKMNLEIERINTVRKELGGASIREVTAGSPYVEEPERSFSSGFMKELEAARGDDLVQTWWEQMRTKALDAFKARYNYNASNKSQLAAFPAFENEFGCSPAKFLTDKQITSFEDYKQGYGLPLKDLPRDWKSLPGAPVSASDPYAVENPNGNAPVKVQKPQYFAR